MLPPDITQCEAKVWRVHQYQSFCFSPRFARSPNPGRASPSALSAARR
jgi:hypothetical protein